MRGLLLVLAFLLWMASAYAEVPQTLHYAGYLTNAVGEPVDCPDPVQCDTPISVTFRLYDMKNATLALWEEVHLGVPVYQGSFHALLGDEVGFLDQTLNGPRWLGITINDANEMLPRQEMASAAFALRAEYADEAVLALDASQLGGAPAADYATQSGLGDLQSSLSPVATQGLPADLADGDDDTQLTEEQVDAFIANNGYTHQSYVDGLMAALSAVASTGAFADLSGVPSDIADGDDDSLAGLSCSTDQVARYDGSAWVCADQLSSAVILGAPGPCDATHTGSMYWDQASETLRICDGTAYRKIKVCQEVCPPPTAVGCGLTVQDDCGASCASAGTGLNLAQCVDPSVVACGQEIHDECDNLCAGIGSALNDSQCDTASTPCGASVVDDCGNSCFATGTQCAAAQFCLETGSCVVPASCKQLQELQPGTPDGDYVITPPGGGLTTVTCNMSKLGGGWTLVRSNHGVHGQAFYDSTWIDPHSSMSYTEVFLEYVSGSAVAGATYPNSHPDSTPIIIEIEGFGWHGVGNTSGSSCGYSYTNDYAALYDLVSPEDFIIQIGFSTTSRFRIGTLEGNAGCTTSDNNGPAFLNAYVR